jgi:NADPH:quinone reductase-like Zn-dependent oxidoreductase
MAEGGMKAITLERYGRPARALAVNELDVPTIDDGQVLVRVHASSVNPADWYTVTGPYFARPSSGLVKPKSRVMAGDLAGRIEAVGKDVTHFKPGDDVFGTGLGAWGEYAAAREIRLAHKPASVTFEEAAAVPVAAITALQALRDHGQIQPGHAVLINGGSGGVGTYAIQLAKVLGATVTAVCSTRNVEQAQALGADRVIDYTQEDFTRTGERYDLLIDIAGSRPLREMDRIMKPDGTIVVVGGRMTYRGLGPIPHLGATLVSAKLRRKRVKFFVAKINEDDLRYLGGLLEEGKLKSMIERRYELSAAADALTYLGEGHARGKIVITT